SATTTTSSSSSTTTSSSSTTTTTHLQTPPIYQFLSVYEVSQCPPLNATYQMPHDQHNPHTITTNSQSSSHHITSHHITHIRGIINKGAHGRGFTRPSLIY